MTRSRTPPAASVAMAAFVATVVALSSACAGSGSRGQMAEWQPVALPDLSRSDEPVRAQLREQHALVVQQQESDAPPSELADAAGRLGMLLQAAEYFEPAAIAYGNTQSLAPDDPRWPYYLGHVYRRLGRTADARAAFARALELRPDDVPTLVWLARTHVEEADAQTAAALLERAQMRAPDAAAVLAARGRLALNRGDNAEAASLLEKALSAAPGALGLHAPLAAAYRALGDLDKAAAHASRWRDVEVPLDDPLMAEVGVILRSAVSYEVRGVRELDRGEWDRAAATFREGRQLTAADGPLGRSLQHKLGLALYLGGQLEESLRVFEEAARLAPPDGHDEPASRVHYSLGIIMASAGRDDDAIAHLTRAIAYDETANAARLALADAYRRHEQHSASLPHYEEVVRRDPQAAEARLGYALALARLDRWVDARRWLEESVAAQPDRLELTHALARVLAAAPDARARDGHRAAELVDVLFNVSKRVEVGETMAMTLAELGDYAKAAAIQRGVIDAAQRAGLADDVGRMTANLRLYEQGKPCRTPWPGDDPIHRPGPPVSEALAASLF